MKFILNLLSLAAIGALGYVAEPFLRDLLIGKTSQPPTAQQSQEPVSAPAANETAVIEPSAPNSPTPAVEPADPAPAVIPADPPITEPTPAPEPATTATLEPAPAETPTPTTPTSGGGSDTVVAAMQASIRAGKIEEFKFDQVQEWTEAPDEEINGETYKIGIASYQAETVFGARVIQAKALIKDGQVQRWVYRKSGMDIK